MGARQGSPLQGLSKMVGHACGVGFPGSRLNKFKASEMEQACCVQGTVSRRPVWLKQKEGKGDRSVAPALGGPVGQREGFEFEISFNVSLVNPSAPELPTCLNRENL